MSRSLRRLMKEASELSSSPSPHFHAAPISDENLFDWHFTLTGPPSTPYASGIYHGRITFPPTYPLRPPMFRFLTPSGRFEVNREICLSISGHHEETWQPAWGVRTALTAIRSFMGGDARGQVGGLDVGDEVRREWAGKSRGWCCAEMGCGGGTRSNEIVLREWRGFCVEQGVDVEREEEDEGVPEGLRMGGKKESTEKNEEGKAEGATDESAKDETKSQETSSMGEPAMDAGEKSPSTSAPDTSTPLPPAAPAQVPIFPSSAVPTPAPASPSQALQQQPRPTPTRATASAPAPVASQDSPWLDRAIFGVLVALILMILRRFVSIED
ncbi:ubiquitin-conjugating enzyme/RWD-like protein [Aspergillus stella-maris]|uniref:ubiquitin-conjugating enzyme/RWD-like protein n=1 Tax=Aspergillus stella-maris TaxID=1810926 RepID=UPI003CCE52B5